MQIGFKSSFLFVVVALTVFTSVTACENKNNKSKQNDSQDDIIQTTTSTFYKDGGDSIDDSHGTDDGDNSQDDDIIRTTTSTFGRDGGDNTQDHDSQNTQDDNSGCVDMNHRIGTNCGRCGLGKYICNENGDAIVCNDPLYYLPDIGAGCGGQCNTATYQCNTYNTSIECVDPLLSFPQPGSACTSAIGSGTHTGTNQCIDNNTTISCITEGNHLWSKGFGDSDYYRKDKSVTTDASGNVFITGNFKGTVDFGGGVLTSAGFSDIFIAKFDKQGNHLFSKRFGDSYSQNSYSITTDASGNVFITGHFGGTVDFGGGVLTSAGLLDIFIVKFDGQGNHLFSKSFGDSDYQYGQSITTDVSGNVFITGEFKGSIDFGGGTFTNSVSGSNIYIAKFDKQGNHLFSKHFGNNSSEHHQSVTTDASGNVFITGNFKGTVDFGGGVLTSTGFYDIYIAKFDKQGNHLFSKRFGDSDHQVNYSIITDVSGNVFITGTFGGTVDFGGGVLTSADSGDIYIAKFDGQGNHLFSKRFGDSDEQSGNSITTDTSGNVFITGEFDGTVDFGGGVLTSAGDYDIFIAKFDGQGNHLFSKRFGDSDRQSGQSITTDVSGNVFITGEFKGTVDFGGGTFTSDGGDYYDIFIAKFSL